MPPSTISYNEVEELYRGGMAKLMLAFDGDGKKLIVRHLQCEKRWCLRSQLQFRRGCKIRAELSSHAHIVKSLAFGSKNFRPYELIEFVDGPSLRRLMNESPEKVAESRLQLTRQAALVLGFIHEKGWMHLDVKPENFIVQKNDDDQLHAKLTDFDLTRKKQTLKIKHPPGTEVYASPELLDGTVSPAADVFAFGVLAYQILTGNSPFAAPYEKKRRWRQRSLKFRPTPVAEVVDEISPKLSQIITTCLEKDPAKRYDDMTQVTRELKLS